MKNRRWQWQWQWNPPLRAEAFDEARRRGLANGLRAALGLACGAAAAWPVMASSAVAPESPSAGTAAALGRHRLAVAWRGPRIDDPQQVTVFDADFGARRLRSMVTQALPGRAHGLQALPDGGVVVSAYRGGRWLLRLDAEGREQARLQWDDSVRRVAGGHVRCTADGRWLLAAVSDVDGAGLTGSGRMLVLDADRLSVRGQFETGGIEPHDFVVLDDHRLLVAHGGILRDRHDRKRSLDRMASSLQAIDLRDGRIDGEWRLDDARLSMRHLGRIEGTDGALRVAVALQSEHDDAGRREGAPAMAVWRVPAGGGEARLDLQPRDQGAGGYVGDVCAAAGTGWVLSHAERGEAWWRAADAPRLHTLARLPQAGALAEVRQGPAAGTVLIAAAGGLAAWHPRHGAAMLPWPQPMAVDNHMAVLQA